MTPRFGSKLEARRQLFWGCFKVIDLPNGFLGIHPRKFFRLEPGNHPDLKENHLNQTFMTLGAMLINFQGCTQNGPTKKTQVIHITSNLHFRNAAPARTSRRCAILAGHHLILVAEGRALFVVEIHPRNLTWNLKIMVSKWTFLFQGLTFRFHVKFRGCTPKISQTAWVYCIEKKDMLTTQEDDIYLFHGETSLINFHLPHCFFLKKVTTSIPGVYTHTQHNASS